MAKLTKIRLLAYLALLGNSAIWALAVPISKMGFKTTPLSPTLFLFARFLLASLASLPIIFLIKKNKQDFLKTFTSPKLFTIIVLEILGTIVTLGLLYWGVSLTSAVEASIISVAFPIFVAIGGVLYFKEKVQSKEALGFFLAIVGTVILTLNPILRNKYNGTLTGNFLVFSQNLAMAIYILSAKKLYKNLNKWVITHLGFWVGTIGFGAILIHQGHSPLEQIQTLFSATNPWMWIPVAYMGILGSIIALTLYLMGQEKIEASEAAIFTYLHPVFSIPGSILLLHESINTIELVSLGIIFLGVLIASKR